MKIIELVETSLLESIIDEGELLIKNVAILGKKSKNGREYSQQAFEDVKTLFENSPSFYEHSKKSRSVKDLIGKFTNLSCDNDYVRGDLHLLENQKWLLDIAKRMPEVVGFSINAVGKMNGNIVESVTEKKSIDLVTNPATVKNLFENVGDEEEEEDNVDYEKKYKELVDKVEEERLDISRNVDLQEQEELKEELETSKKELVTLKEEIKVREEQEKKKVLIQEKIDKSGLKKEHLSKTFLSVLAEAKDIKDVDALIQDRKALLKMKKVPIIERQNSGEGTETLEKDIMEAIE